LRFSICSIIYLLIALGFALTSNFAEAEEGSLNNFRYELLGNANAEIKVHTADDHYKNLTDHSTIYQAAMGLGYFFTNQWEPIFQLGLTDTTGANAGLTGDLWVGAIYNFGDDVTKAFFVGLKVGDEFITNSQSRSFQLLEYSLSVGKRISVAPGISWVPEIAYYHRDYGYESDANGYSYFDEISEFRVYPFQISILF